MKKIKEIYKKNEGKICILVVLIFYIHSAIIGFVIDNGFHFVVVFCFLLILIKYAKAFFANKKST